jgi:hypothetical protein
MSTKNSDKTKIVTKTVTKIAECVPTANLKVTLKKAGVDYIRYFLGGPGGNIPSEFILHRPVGKTTLKTDDWVRSTPDEFQMLLARTTSPHTKKLAAARLEHKKQAAVTANLIKIDATTKAVQYPSGTDRIDFLKDPRMRAKKAAQVARALAAPKAGRGGKRNSVPTSSPPAKSENSHLVDILSQTLGDDAKAELAYSEFLQSDLVKEASEAAHPDTFLTQKGVTADTPQEALPAASGMTQEELQLFITKAVVELVEDTG